MGYGITVKEAVVLTFAGLRGVIAIAMALIVKLEIISPGSDNEEFKDLVMFHCCLIVVWTLLINGSTMKYLVEHLELNKTSKEAQVILTDAMTQLREEMRREMEAMKVNRHYSGANWEEV